MTRTLAINSKFGNRNQVNLLIVMYVRTCLRHLSAKALGKWAVREVSCILMVISRNDDVDDVIYFCLWTLVCIVKVLLIIRVGGSEAG